MGTIALRYGRALRCLAPIFFLATSCAASEPANPAIPVEAIVEAFETHSIVALGDGNHGNEQIHQMRVKLLRDPRFQTQVRDIVVEFGNSRYQAVIDRFVSGEAVPERELRKVWQDTAQANPVWDVPVYEAFFREVRAINASVPEERRLRVILGDVPFDWSDVSTTADYARQPQRSDRFTAGLVSGEVLAKDRKALVVFGEMHLLREPLAFVAPEGAAPSSIEDEPSIVALLEK
jgi:hypothetical protein